MPIAAAALPLSLASAASPEAEAEGSESVDEDESESSELLSLVSDDEDEEVSDEEPLEVVDACEAFWVPQVTLWQAAWPERSLGCAAVQSVIHCWQT